MTHSLRVFRKDFLEHLHLADAWPKSDALRAWLRDYRGSGIRNGVCRSLAQGRPQAEKYIGMVVDYLRQEREPRYDPPRYQTRLYAYVRQAGLADPASLSVQQIVECVSEPAEACFLDPFREGIALVKDVFERVRNPACCVQLCRDPSDVREAVRWMFIEAGRQSSRARLSTNEAMTHGEARIGTSLLDYQERAVSWWCAEPWSIVLARGHRKPAGMSIALPLNSNAYEAVRSGERKTYWCAPGDLCGPSPQILVEGMAMRPPEEGPESGGPNIRLVVAMACQQAHLSDVPGIGEQMPLRLLTFAAAPKQRQRALQFGYEPTGTHMQGTDIEFMERKLFMRGRGIREWGLWGIWTGLQRATALFA